MSAPVELEALRPRGHGAVVDGLWAAAARSRLPHALLFEGPDGIGKFRAARWLAVGLLCERGPGEPCGACGGCRRAASGADQSNHPDLFQIDPVADGVETIAVGKIAERDGNRDCAEAFLSLRAAEGGWRVVLVREAHRMRIEAQNALLKTLEEPATGTLLVLETAHPDRLLPTIRSRVTRVRFEPLDGEQTGAILREIAGAEATFDEAQLTRVARWAGGSPGRATELARRAAPEIRALFAEVFAGRRSALSVSPELWALDGEFPGETAAAVKRSRARAVLDLLLDLLADANRLTSGTPSDALRHADLAPSLIAWDRGAGGVRVRAALESALQARQDVDGMLSPEAAIDRVLGALDDPLRDAARAR